MKKYFLALLLVAAMLAAAPCMGASSSGKNAAEPMRAAEAWLSLADAMNAQESWNQAAAAFKAAVELQNWEKTLPKARQPLGAVKTRTHLATKATTTLPGVPDGEYVVMRFQTEFANKKSAIEVLLLQKETDGAWRTVGYFIR
ncbi:MAG: hypothetical protein DESF_01750 [Desulfovibrio sp.]